MQSTLGFSPVVQRAKNWSSQEGRSIFLKLVQDMLNERIGEDVVIQDKSEIYKILHDTVTRRSETDEIVYEAAEYAVQQLVGRIHMHTHLASMSSNPIRTQHHGGCDREKGCLPMKDVKNCGAFYGEYLKEQNKFR